MREHNYLNCNIDLPVFEKRVETCVLFQCPKCGVHPDVISQTWVPGYEDEILTKRIFILPEDEVLLEQWGELHHDGVIEEHLICGKCGQLGQRANIPMDVLEKFDGEIKR